jgi:phage tail protein X
MTERYTTIQGDTWDMAAKKVYGEEKYLDYLMSNNFNCLNYFIFPAGISLKTPPLPTGRTNGVPVWRTNNN